MKAQKTIRRKELAATISLLLAAYPAVYAQAQDAEAEDQTVNEVNLDEEAEADLGTLVVTGLRAGLQTSVDIKRTETSIVEAVSAEEIGKLPDQSITDSLARLPGVTTQRLNGRSQVLSVRGLGPDFTSALLNGREQVSSGDNRGVEFDAYPSELIQSAVVYKTPDASLMGTSIAGTVDLRTIRPLEFGRRAVAANARYEWNDIDALNDDADDSGYRASLSYVDQFADDTIGVAFGMAYLDSPTQSERYNAWGFPTTGDGDLIIGGAKPYAQSNNLERLGVMGVLEYKPSDTFNTTLDMYYSSFEEDQLLRGIELPLWWSSAALQPGFSVDNGLVQTGTFDNVKGVMRNDLNRRDADFFAFGWNMEFGLSDRWTLTTDLSYSEVDRKDIILETYSGTGPAGEGATDSLGFTMRPGQGALFSPSINYADPNLIFLTSPQGWGGDIVPGGQLGYSNEPDITDELTIFNVKAERMFDSGAIRSVEVGVDYRTREKAKGNDEFFLGLANGTNIAPLPSNTGFTDLSFLGIPGMVTYDPIAAINSGIFTKTRNPNADVVIKGWTVEEDIWTAFAMANIDTIWGDIPIFGNFGVQVVYTDQSSNADSASGTGDSVSLVAVNGGDSYTEILPSFNITFDLGNENYIRGAYARTLARARMDDLRASLNYGFNVDRIDSDDINFSPWGAGGGNPELRPYIADAFDLSYEKYFSDGIGYVSIAAFYKDLDSWVLNQNLIYDFSDFPENDFYMPVLTEGLVNVPVNVGGGSITGFELAGSLNLGMFADWLEGFGLVGSASFTDSSIDDGSGGDINIPGLSEDVYNLTAYYENDRFSVRVSGRYRSEFLGEVSGFGNGRDFRTVNEETVVDAQANYFFGGNLEGLSLLFQVSNLTDEEFVTYGGGDERQVIDYQQYGRTYLVGLAYAWD